MSAARSSEVKLILRDDLLFNHSSYPRVIDQLLRRPSCFGIPVEAAPDEVGRVVLILPIAVKETIVRLEVIASDLLEQTTLILAVEWILTC